MLGIFWRDGDMRKGTAEILPRKLQFGNIKKKLCMEQRLSQPSGRMRDGDRNGMNMKRESEEILPRKLIVVWKSYKKNSCARK